MNYYCQVKEGVQVVEEVVEEVAGGVVEGVEEETTSC